MPDVNTAWSIAAVVLVALVGGVVAWRRRGKPARDREDAGWNAILGKPPVLDRAGKEIEAEQPGLVHVTRENADRLTKVEEAFIELKDLVTAQDSLKKQVHAHDLRLNDHDSSIAALIAQTFERGATSALTAVEKAQRDRS